MKTLALTVLLTAQSLCANDSPKCPLPHGRWEPIPELTDEFDGDRLDADLGHPNNPTWKGRQPGFFSKDNFTVRDGKLHLTARKEDLPNLPEGYHTFTTAAVKSEAKVLYGYFEIRCRPMDSWASSAFWFYHQTPDWWTEIDVFEVGGGHPEHKKIVHMNAHVFRTPEDGAKHWSKGGQWVAPFRLADGYHTYALEWSKEELKYYVDGKPVRDASQNRRILKHSSNSSMQTQGPRVATRLIGTTLTPSLGALIDLTFGQDSLQFLNAFGDCAPACQGTAIAGRNNTVNAHKRIAMSVQRTRTAGGSTLGQRHPRHSAPPMKADRRAPKEAMFSARPRTNSYPRSTGAGR